MQLPDINNAAEVARAVEAGWLPDGWMRADGVVIVPDGYAEQRPRGSTVIMAMLDEIRTVSGKVVKSREVR